MSFRVLCAGVLGVAVFGASASRSFSLPVQASQPAAPAGQLPPLPLTQLDDRALAADLDNRALTLTFAQPIAVRDLLLLLVRGTSLSVIPDPQIAGSFIGELKSVTVRQALGLILPQLGLDFAVDGSFVRVFRREPETRLFDINYIATERTGSFNVGEAGAGARVSSTTSADVFADLVKGVQTLLTEHATFNVDRKAGLLQVTDFPERLERVSLYLDAVHDHVHRQVQIDARVLEVELNDPDARSLDWTALARSAGAAAAGVTPSLSPRPVSASLRVGSATLRVGDVPRFLAALAEQGKVSTLASPQVLALNNEPAVVRATSRTPSADGGRPQEQGVTLGVTPQIAADGVVMLSLSPIVSVQTADAAGKALPPTAIREADMLARVGDGETIVIAGLTREREIRERRTVGFGGGWLGRSTVVIRKRVELVILLTPTILAPVGAH
jgi:type II secretory pathway component GspD/PulD (secretin)